MDSLRLSWTVQTSPSPQVNTRSTVLHGCLNTEFGWDLKIFGDLLKIALGLAIPLLQLDWIVAIQDCLYRISSQQDWYSHM